MDERRKVGDWNIDAREQHKFRYEQTWVDAADARPISLSMPVQPPEAPYRGPLVESFFENLLPDSNEFRRRVQTRFAAASTSAFDLLFEIGRDCVGAIQLLPPDQASENVKQIDAEPLDEEGIANILRSATSSTCNSNNTHIQIATGSSGEHADRFIHVSRKLVAMCTDRS